MSPSEQKTTRRLAREPVSRLQASGRGGRADGRAGGRRGGGWFLGNRRLTPVNERKKAAAVHANVRPLNGARRFVDKPDRNTNKRADMWAAGAAQSSTNTSLVPDFDLSVPSEVSRSCVHEAVSHPLVL